jgi:hypothetical protein
LRELVFMPHTRRSQSPSGSAQLGGFLPFRSDEPTAANGADR